jgi:hypothetical protein
VFPLNVVGHGFDVVSFFMSDDMTTEKSKNPNISKPTVNSELFLQGVHVSLKFIPNTVILNHAKYTDI